MEEEEVKKGSPAWMATFSDLMSLLMCFFVLLLSFSEMDVLKFKQIAGSMKNAFGVQNLLEVKDIPKGTSVIAQEFRPGRPEPTPIEVIMQQTAEMTRKSLDFHEGEMERAGGQKKDDGKLQGGSSPSHMVEELDTPKSEGQDEMQAMEQQIVKDFEKEIVEGALDVENLGQELSIRIKEKGAFPEDSAFLQPQFKPLIRKIGKVVKDIPGKIIITGHTDRVKLDSELYRSNWDLSAQRAVSVAHELEMVRGFDKERMIVVGKAGTEPLYPNDTPAHRALNRRVEISILQGKPKESDEIQVDKALLEN